MNGAAMVVETGSPSPKQQELLLTKQQVDYSEMTPP